MLVRQLACLLVTLGCAAGLSAQTQDRIVGTVNPTHTVVLSGNLHPNARPELDQGPVDPSLPMSLTLLLKPSMEQQRELQQLLTEQQDPSSPNYHNWLTPEQYADRFGASSADLAKIADWARSQGFAVGYVARGRDWIVLNGTAAQVRQALHTEIHIYRVEGEMHYANAMEPSIPAALGGLVGSIQGLNDFHLKPAAVAARSLSAAGLQPEFNAGTAHYVAPDDFATIYDASPLYLKGVNGTGQKIAVAGQTDVDLADIQLFRRLFVLPGNLPQVVLVPCTYYSSNTNCTSDPGTSSGDLIEADLDLEWSGAVAPNATVLYVNSPDVLISAEYAIDQMLAPVISFSYGACELFYSPSAGIAFETIAQQANVEGITWVASSGDSGAAGCDQQGIPNGTVSILGLAVILPASIPEVTAVGGTAFSEGNGVYWNRTTSARGESALSYMPETTWNETSSAFGLAAGGGGVSIFFDKPLWQIGATPSTMGHRAVPDVALTAAIHDSYLFVTGGNLHSVAGTSASAQAFAGLVVLLDQSQSPSGLGNINPTLYRLAQSTPGIFHDITSGNNIVPCVAGLFGCPTSGTIGYSATAGFDLVTGLGSVDASNLVSGWSGAGAAGFGTATTTRVTASPTSIPAGSSTVLTATVTANSGTAAPSGAVTFRLSGGIAIGSATLSGSGSSSSASLTVHSGLLSLGSNLIIASYDGSNGFSQSSASVAINVTPGTAAVIDVAIGPAPVYKQGSLWPYTITLTETAGVSATITSFKINGVDNSPAIALDFGSSTLPALGTLSASLAGANLAAPLNRVFVLIGFDANGNQWSQQITVPFLGVQGTALSYYFANVAVNNIWRTTFTYVNASTRAVTCTTYFFGDSGEPISPFFNGQPVTSTADTIPAGGVARRETDAQPNLPEVTGWARADCTGPVKASAVFHSDDGTASGEASVIASTAPAATFVSYADTRTVITWANPSPTTAYLDVQAVDANGHVVASNVVTLPPGYHSAATVGALLNAPGIQGSVAIVATQPVIALAVNFEAAPVFSCLPPPDVDSTTPTGAANYYFAHIAAADIWRTTFTYVNLSLQPVTCQTSFLSNSGAPLALLFNGTSVTATTDVIPPGGTVRRQTDAQPSSPEVDGWAVANCSGPVKASALFRTYNQTLPTGEASVSASTVPAATFVTYADQTTGVAWANPSQSSVTLTLRVKDASGTVLATNTITVGANGHGSANVGSLMNLSNFQGSLTITATHPVISLVLNFDAAPAFSSSPPGN